ncbi:MAG TPA: glycosyltransferase [Candidatus Xenobia bacterium]|jgi:ceramide glucosyltransferase
MADWLPWTYLAVGAIVLAHALCFTRTCRRLARQSLAPYTPSVSLVVSCKTAPLTESLKSLVGQRYPDYETVFVVASRQDPAWPVVSRLAAEFPHARVVVAGYSPCAAEKTHNLVTARASCRGEVLAFADSDIQVPPDWLERLVAPLQSARVGITTAGRLPLLPSPVNFWAASLLRLIFSTTLVCFGGGRNISAWGGSMALRREVFDRLDVAARWSNSVDDDVSITAYVRAAGLAIRFVGLFIPTRVPGDMRSAFGWSIRQMQYLWWYDRFTWATLAFLTMGPTVVLLGLLGAHALRLFVLCAVLHAGIVAIIFWTVHRITSTQGHGQFPPGLALVSPVVVAMAAVALGIAATRRTMLWSGVEYRVHGSERVEVVAREVALEPVVSLEKTA